jgi:hypothetical protein
MYTCSMAMIPSRCRRQETGCAIWNNSWRTSWRPFPKVRSTNVEEGPETGEEHRDKKGEGAVLGATSRLRTEK